MKLFPGGGNVTRNESQVVRDEEHGRHFLDGDEAELEVVPPEADLDEAGAAKDHLQPQRVAERQWSNAIGKSKQSAIFRWFFSPFV